MCMHIKRYCGILSSVNVNAKFGELVHKQCCLVVEEKRNEKETKRKERNKQKIAPSTDEE